MSRKVTCPACVTTTSNVAFAFDGGQPCPHCGLSAEAALAFTVALARGADTDLVDIAAQAVRRAELAEAEVERLRYLIGAVRAAVNEAGS